MARSQLHEQTAEAGAQRCQVRKERLEQLCTARETLVMRDLARDLYGKPERSRHARGPPFKRRGAMRPIESGIDFDSGKRLRVAREERVARRKAGLVRARNAPSCSPDIDFRGHLASLSAPREPSVGLGRERHLSQSHAVGSEYRIRNRGADDADAGLADIGVTLVAAQRVG